MGLKMDVVMSNQFSFVHLGHIMTELGLSESKIGNNKPMNWQKVGLSEASPPNPLLLDLS
jgi:hypothetical protein